MANVAVVYTQDYEVADRSYLTFVDTETGDVQKHAVNEALASADYASLGGINFGVRFFGYVPGLGAVYLGNVSNGTTIKTALYVLSIGENENAQPSGVFTRTTFSLASGLGVGVDVDGAYTLEGAFSAPPSYVYNTVTRFGFDGTIAKAQMNQYRLTRGSYCPVLWRGPTGFRVFLQQGNDYTSNLRGASEQFNFISGSTVSVFMDMTRTTTTAGYGRGPEFSGFFYGYQPQNVWFGNAYSSPFDGATVGISWSATDPSGGTLISVGYSGNASAVYQLTASIVQSGTSYFQSNVDVGTIITGDNTDGYPTGYVGDLPPYKSAGAFWTDLVYSLEIV